MRLDICSTVTFLKRDSALVGVQKPGTTGIPREQVLSEQSSERSKLVILSVKKSENLLAKSLSEYVVEKNLFRFCVQ